MDIGFWVLNGAYLVYVASSAFKNMLPLRALLLLSTIGFITYGVIEPVWSLVWWNVPFGIIQSYQIWKLIKERLGINLSDEEEAIRTLMFGDLDRPLFNKFWQAGTSRTFNADDTIVEYDQPVDSLMLVLTGEVEVRPPNRSHDDPLRLGRLRLLGEMSTVSGNNASATVTASGPVRVRSWKKTELEKLGDEHPEIQRRALLVIGQELSRKVQ